MREILKSIGEPELPEFFSQYANPIVIEYYDTLNKKLTERLLPYYEKNN